MELQNQNQYEKRKTRTNARNQTLINRFNALFNKNRIRYDDVLETVAKEFNLSKLTAENIIKRYKLHK